VTVDFVDDFFRQNGLTVLVAFSSADDEATSLEVDVLYPQGQALLQP